MAAATKPRRKRKKQTKAQLHRALLRRHRDQYEEILAAQGGVCAICGADPPEDRRLDMDHDHAALFIRGLLCRVCNQNLAPHLGKEPDAAWHERAAEYLARGDHLGLH